MATIALASLSTLTTFAADPAITVSAQQRYPWNGLVDVHFTITGDAGTKYDTSFTAKDMVGNTNIAMRTIRKADGTTAAAKEQLLPGTYNWVWDAAADLPKDFKCDRVTVTGTADSSAFPYSVKFNANGGTGTMANESFTYGTAKALTANAFTRTGYTFQGWATSSSSSKVYNDKQTVSNLTATSGAVVNLYAVWKARLYMVIDLSSGSSSSKYPVSYLDAAPSGGFNVNSYKTTKLVLRCVPAGTFTMGRRASDYPDATANGLHSVTLTKDFYVGVFEVTQKQYSLITGSNPSSYVGDMRPVEQTTFNGLRGSTKGAKWPASSEVDASSVIGKLRTRTSVSGLDLPTEAQWEYACRAGTTTALNSGKNLTSTTQCSNMAAVGRYGYNSGEQGTSDGKGGYSYHTTVGSYAANKWGLYDMHGNVWEWCLDWNGSLSSSAVTDPKGPASGDSREVRGGCWAISASRCSSPYRATNPPNNGYNATGFRLVVNLP